MLTPCMALLSGKFDLKSTLSRTVPHLESVLTGRAIGFLQNHKNSKKDLIKLLFHSCSADLSSVTGRNMNFLLEKYGKASQDELFRDKIEIKN